MNLSEDQMPENVKNVDGKKRFSKAKKHKSSACLKQASNKNDVKPKATSLELKQVHVPIAKIKGKLKKESPVKHKHSPVPTPGNEQSSPRKHHAAASKRLKLDLKENVKEENDVEENKAKESMEDDSSDDEEIEWEDVDGRYTICVLT